MFVIVTACIDLTIKDIESLIFNHLLVIAPDLKVNVFLLVVQLLLHILLLLLMRCKESLGRNAYIRLLA